MGALKAVEKDMAAFRGAMKYFGLTNPANTVELKEPERAIHCGKAVLTIKRRFAAEPDKNFLMLWVLAGHGMNWSGY